MQVLDDVRSEYDARLRSWMEPKPQPTSALITLNSKLSEYVRAADIAAGLGATTYRDEDLIGLVRRFDFVVVNGSRLSEADAIAQMAKRKHR